MCCCHRSLSRGRVLPADSTLAAAGVGEDDVITVVRIELMAEGWKVRAPLLLLHRRIAMLMHVSSAACAVVCEGQEPVV